MPYFKRSLVRRLPPQRRGMMGFGDYDDSTQCSSIPKGDSYRKPGNYCATPDGGMTTFNSDGSTYWAPGAVNPDPANLSAPGVSSSSSSGAGILDTFLKTLAPPATATLPVAAPGPGGLSTTTWVLLGGGVLVAVLLLARR